ncbi:hypothetical protein EMCRGX_G008772 [Ephydatia muelleri]
MENKQCMSCKLDSWQLVTVQYRCNCDPYTLCVACVQRLTKCPEHPQSRIESKSEPRGQNRAFSIPASEWNLYSEACACCQLCFLDKERVKITEYNCKIPAHRVYLCIACHDHSRRCIVDQQYETFASQQQW